MEFVCSREALLPELEIAGRVTIGNHSYYSCVNLVVKDGALSIRSSKIVISFISKIVITQKWPGEANVFCADLLALIKGMPSGDIFFKMVENNLLIGNNQGIGYSLPTAKVFHEAWSGLFHVPKEGLVILDCVGLFDKVSHAIAPMDNIHEYFKGAYLFSDGNNLISSGCNGYMVSIVERKCKSRIQGIIIPPETTSLLIKFFNSEVTQYGNIGKRIYFMVDNRTLISSVIDFGYPDPKHPVPDSFDHKVKLQKKDLIDALLRLKIIHSPLHGCIFNFEGDGKIRISTKDKNGLKIGTEEVEIIEGKEVTTKFRANLDYMLSSLQHVEGEEMILEYKESERVERTDKGDKVRMTPFPESDYFHMVQCQFLNNPYAEEDPDEQSSTGTDA
jgi:DNA polymerase-3 subunit beta